MSRSKKPTSAMRKLQIVSRPKISMSGIRSVVGCSTATAQKIFDSIQNGYRDSGQLIYDRKKVLTRDFLESQGMTLEDLLRQYRIESTVDLWHD